MLHTLTLQQDTRHVVFQPAKFSQHRLVNLPGVITEKWSAGKFKKRTTG
jgi:hypothetical protein